MNQVAVIYVSRFADGLYNYQRFMASIERQRGIDFKLFIVYKGFPDIETMLEWHRYITYFNYRSIMMADYGYDLTAYHVAARIVSVPKLIFFNTSSELTHEECIKRLVLGLQHVDVCGCFGSWETFNKSWLSRIIWPAFPNPHLRTNGFAIRRDDFLSVWPSRFYTKFGCHRWESGRNGFSRRFFIGVANNESLNVHPMQFDKAGYRYDSSKLLCQDNQSRRWDALSPAGKQFLCKITWNIGCQ